MPILTRNDNEILLIDIGGFKQGKFSDPLLNNLFKRGLARPDCLRLGLDVENNGALKDSLAHESTLCYTIGPVLKGVLWESTAVPEIRQQVVALSELLLIALKANKSELAESYS